MPLLSPMAAHPEQAHEDGQTLGHFREKPLHFHPGSHRLHWAGEFRNPVREAGASLAAFPSWSLGTSQVGGSVGILAHEYPLVSK